MTQTPGFTTTPSATPTPSTTPTPSGIPIPTEPTDWQTAPDQAALEGVTFEDVVWTGARLVAVGYLDDGAGVFLDSTDAVTWHRGTTVQDGYANRIAASRGGLVAIGSVGGHATSWSSPDGLSWSEARDAFPLPALGTDTIGVTDVTASDGGWLAVGRRDPECFINCGLAPKRSYVWRSGDGLHWTRLEDQPALKGGGMNAVSRSRVGFVAAGGAGDHAAVWLSADGQAWTRIPDAPLFHGPTSEWGGQLPAAATEVGVVGDVIAVLGGAYAQEGCPPGTATRLCPGPRAWWSEDGLTWSRASFRTARNGQLNALGVVRDGLMAVGWSQTCAAGVWTSADGHAWACLDSGPPDDLSEVAVGGNDALEVVLGQTNAAPEGADKPDWVSRAWYRTAR